MINSVKIIPFEKGSNSAKYDRAISIYPIEKKSTIKLEPDFSIAYYCFEVSSQNDLIAASISLNQLEVFDLNPVDVETDIEEYIFQSKKLKARNFLQFNLGLYEFTLEGENFKERLATVHLKSSGNLSQKVFSEMYNKIAESDLFELFLSENSRANTTADWNIDPHSSNSLIKLALARKLVAVTKKLIIGELEFITRITSTSEVQKYSHHSSIEENDIVWLTENPNQLSASHDGYILINGINHELDLISQSIFKKDYDTFENRLIISTLYSARDELARFTEKNKEKTFFPYKVFEKTITEISNNIEKITLTTRLQPPFNEIPGVSSKLQDDLRYSELLETILKWFYINNFEFGKENRAPTPNITKIFEYYCFIEIVSSLEILGYVRKSHSKKSNYETASVAFIKENTTIYIYYEPMIRDNAGDGIALVTSKIHPRPYEPDFLIMIERDQKKVCGILDAKYASIQSLQSKSSNIAQELFYKYGLFIHTKDLKPLDFVYAMHLDPQKNEFSINDYRAESFQNLIKPKLGLCSIKIGYETDLRFTNFLQSLINSSNDSSLLSETGVRLNLPNKTDTFNQR